MKRRIIRSFFIGLLLLCVGGWAGSFYWSIMLRLMPREGPYEYYAMVDFGRLHLHRFHPPDRFVDQRFGFSLDKIEAAGSLFDPLPPPPSFQSMRFEWSQVPELDLFVPLWFPTTISAALLWLVWRKTRPKPMAGAFPVELAKPKVDP